MQERVKQEVRRPLSQWEGPRPTDGSGNHTTQSHQHIPHRTISATQCNQCTIYHTTTQRHNVESPTHTTPYYQCHTVQSMQHLPHNHTTTQRRVTNAYHTASHTVLSVPHSAINVADTEVTQTTIGSDKFFFLNLFLRSVGSSTIQVVVLVGQLGTQLAPTLPQESKCCQGGGYNFLDQIQIHWIGEILARYSNDNPPHRVTQQCQDGKSLHQQSICFLFTSYFAQC